MDVSFKNIEHEDQPHHVRALRTVYFDYKSFCELLEKNKSFSMDHKNIQSLVIEIYKFLT